LTKIVHAMLGKGLGGLEKVFLDYQPVLSACADARGGVCLPIMRRGAAIVSRLAPEHCGATIPAFSAWDPVTLYAARRAIGVVPADIALCHGQRAYRVMKRVTPARTRLVACIHKPHFDVELTRTDYICVGSHLADSARSAGISPSRIHFIPNAVGEPSVLATPFANGQRAPHILAAGRLHPKKGFDLFLVALAALRAQGFAFRATIAGDGDERQALEGICRDLRLEDRVSFPGWCDDMVTLLASADVFAFPSRQEGFPLMLLEAMASGLPVVATRIPGTVDILRGDADGLLVPADDLPLLVAALAETLKNPGAALMRAASGSRRVRESFGYHALELRLTKIIDGLLSEAMS
jgi:glycosyltransferase involved in cell wall biosynthesis